MPVDIHHATPTDSRKHRERHLRRRDGPWVCRGGCQGWKRSGERVEWCVTEEGGGGCCRCCWARREETGQEGNDDSGTDVEDDLAVWSATSGQEEIGATHLLIDLRRFPFKARLSTPLEPCFRTPLTAVRSPNTHQPPNAPATNESKLRSFPSRETLRCSNSSSLYSVTNLVRLMAWVRVARKMAWIFCGSL